MDQNIDQMADQNSDTGNDQNGAAPDVKVEGPEMKESGNKVETFKTPSFVIPSKKKVQSNTDASAMFKSPGILPQKNDGDDIKKSEATEQVETETVKSEKDLKETTKTAHKKYENTDEKFPSKKTVVLSPAEQFKQANASIPYKEPAWGALCEEKFALEVIKNGSVIDNIDLASKTFHVIGRLPSCDIPMEHPSLSRHHAVIQYSGGKSEQYPAGWYLYDLDSTHGTWINKNKVPSQKFHQIHVDYVLKFGGSSRLFILQGPDTDREEESEMSPAEMKEQREKQKKEADLIRQAEIDEAERKAELLKKREESKGCSWGIDDDEIEEEDENAENPFAAIEPENEALYINDPKKSLNGYFEREGLELPEYEFHEAGFGKWKCTVELPIDAPSGEPIVAEVIVSGKKREAVIACALEACRILDRHGELRKSAQESRKRKQRNWEDDDFYDSDEDVYLDRTGAIEKKRELRKNKVGKTDKVTETYDTLVEKHKSIIAEIEEIEAKLEQAKAEAAAMESDDVDALDAYMSAIKSGMMDTKTKMKFKRQLLELKQEEQKVRKLVNIAKPASLPEISNKSLKTDVKKPSVIASVGKMKGPLHGKTHKKIVPGPKPEKTEEKSDESEEEDDDDKNDNLASNSGADIKANEKVSEISSKNDVEIKVEKKHSDDQPKVKGPALPPAQERTKQLDPVKQEVHSKSRLKGPSLPLAAVLEKLQEENANDDENDDNNSEKKTRDSNKRKSKHSSSDSKKLKSGDSYTTDDPDYAVWLPPENQSGDGKTHLNAKLGY
ncbi:kanadaptin-like [Ruditapes philippinarum]|uniref:kanadaptin-like n=1 Tax=Ruditapes philippinarum TaxID=129788 RepID=UPI00295ADD37|nr:kanadaptin-like [Ruditapes philippinarum]